ncbi:MAG: tRNA (guanosine(37)-N1)-methyltransferase TrmD, partial [Cyanobacteriota bacterium]
LLEYPQYTRPPEFQGHRVPDVLLSGDHQAIARWRQQQQLIRTWQRRPDLLAKRSLTAQERHLLETGLAEDKTDVDVEEPTDAQKPSL